MECRSARKAKQPYVLNDIKIRRCIECTDLKVGDTVAVKYKGEISDRNEINGAYSICKGTLVDGELAVTE